MIPIDIQVSRSKVKPTLLMLGKGGICVLQTAIFSKHSPTNRVVYEINGGPIDKVCSKSHKSTALQNSFDQPVPAVCKYMYFYLELND